MTSLATRGKWSSRLGFILAAAGSAIGLGNIWRFPYTAGQYGGGAFILLYLAFVALIGIPVLLAELSMGRNTERNAVGAFKALLPGSWWPWVGGLGVVTGFGILSFYSVIAGWTLYYAFKSLTGEFGGDFGAEASGAIFSALTADGSLMVILTAVFLLLTALVVRRGVSAGIERTVKVLMPVFFAVLVLLVIRSVTLPGADKGLSFLFSFDLSKLANPAAVGSALGQALFSLSIGMGAMITYGSYLSREENLPRAGVIVAFFDTGIALVAGLMIFPAVFAMGGSPAAGPGLVFVTMPTVFGQMPAGNFMAFAFYALLAIAALTSTISLLEVIVAYFVDEKGWSRERATWSMTAACFALAIPSALSNGAVDFLSKLPGGGFLGLCNIIFGNYFLSIGAVFICLFVGWKWGIGKALEEMRHGDGVLPAGKLWGIMVRYVCPVAVVAVLIYAAITGQYL
ncbi:MAG: sodium-dependent transporter [Thermoanaerobaculia bacterium]